MVANSDAVVSTCWPARGLVAVPASMRRRPPRETRTTGVGTSGSRNHTKTSVTSVSTRRWGCFDVKAVFLAGVAGVPEGLALNPIAAGEVGPVGAMTVRFHIGGILSNFGSAGSRWSQA